MAIEAYGFGEITVDGTTYTTDIKIVDGRIVADWWRLEGHSLELADIDDVLAARPEVLVVGTGHSGLMAVSADVERRLAAEGIELAAAPTAEACRIYNSLVRSRRVAFAAHLTC